MSKIGVFDSGIGGLTVMKEFLRRLPAYDYVYLGDNKRSPYGDRNQKEIYGFTREALDFLFGNDCSLVVIACNTASAKALRKIQRDYLPKRYPGKKVLGVIIPTVENVAENKYKKIGLIGTKSTVRSEKYSLELKKLDRRTEVIGLACPKLVPLIEGGKAGSPETGKALEAYLSRFQGEAIEALILGCTHYPLLKERIRKVLVGSIDIIDPPAIIARKLAAYLRRHKELDLSKRNKRIFFTTGNAGRFKKLAHDLFGLKIDKISKIKL